MKLVVVLLFLSITSFAQDGYHQIEKPTCQSETCLVFDGEIEIGFVTYEDIDGFTVKELNSDSTLTDTIYEDSKVCFRGKHRELFEILHALAGNNAREYYNGGHQVVEGLGLGIISKDEYLVQIKVRSDYGDYEISKPIKRCE